ncbi:hypothetical protein DHEL01_v210597 [Diaporthe helianthi]|uniref:Uncharacterized protein n=1 Tax=Diaporthe helianthi TaxID=158607 RepID=A0A2P5HL91_DIAHE|nr:hypothetical protein DHEL01_v210597 [Diaporthe helianthi]
MVTADWEIAEDPPVTIGPEEGRGGLQGDENRLKNRFVGAPNTECIHAGTGLASGWETKKVVPIIPKLEFVYMRTTEPGRRVD